MILYLHMSKISCTFALGFVTGVMKQTVIHIALLCVLIALPTCAWADISHNFQSKRTLPYTLVTVDETHMRSTTDDIVYTLGRDTYFGYDCNHSSGTDAVIALNLFKITDYVIVSPVDKLSELTITHYSDKADNTLSSSKIQIQLSKDGSNWTSVTPTITYRAGFISVVAPSADAYYVKITSLSATKISILQIDYIISDCNCFTYTIE